MKRLRTQGDEQMAHRRWEAQAARMQTAALNGELGTDAQLVAMSVAYADLMASGQVEQARALKAQAIAISTQVAA